MILQHVPSFELCKELKRLGYPQACHFIWCSNNETAELLHSGSVGLICRERMHDFDGSYAAPLVSDMAVWIIGKKYVCPMWNEFNGSWILSHPASGYSYRGSMPDAYATQCVEILKVKEKP